LIQKETYIISNIGKKDILADVCFSGNISAPFVVFCHGYKGYKDWGAWNLVAESFAERGFNFIKFNFSHNGGTIDNPIDFPDLEAFGKNTYSLELEDVKRVIDDAEVRFNVSDFNLIGHSRGGGISILYAAGDDRIKKISSWAAVSDFAARFPKGTELETWKSEGVRYVINGRTKQEMPHYYGFYTDFVENENQLNILSAARNMNKPFQIIHGTEDKAVLIEEAHALKSAFPDAQLNIFETGHTFDSSHPWSENKLPQSLEDVTKSTQNFFKSI